MTDNAQRTDTDKKNDLFLAMGTSNRFTKTGNIFGFRLGYQDYSSENGNDVFSWGLSDEIKCWGDKTCEFDLKGQHYVYGEPMTTDNSFSNYALAAAVTRSRDLPNKLSLDLSGGLEVRNYPSLNRLDNTGYFRTTLSHDLNSRIYLEAGGEADG